MLLHHARGLKRAWQSKFEWQAQAARNDGRKHTRYAGRRMRRTETIASPGGARASKGRRTGACQRYEVLGATCPASDGSVSKQADINHRAWATRRQIGQSASSADRAVLPRARWTRARPSKPVGTE